jgi:hypothetical protein
MGKLARRDVSLASPGPGQILAPEAIHPIKMNPQIIPAHNFTDFTVAFQFGVDHGFMPKGTDRFVFDARDKQGIQIGWIVFTNESYPGAD